MLVPGLAFEVKPEGEIVHTSEVFAIILGDGEVYTVGGNGRLRVLDTNDHAQLSSVPITNGWSSALAESGGDIFIGNDDGTIAVVDRRDLVERSRLSLGAPVHSVFADAKVVVGATEGGPVVVFDAVTLAERGRLFGEAFFHGAVADDRFIYAGGGGNPCGAYDPPGGLTIWERDDLAQVTRIPTSSFIWTVAVDGSRILTGAQDGWLRVFDRTTFGRRDLIDMGSAIYSLLVDPRYVYVGMKDGRVSVLDRATLEERATLRAGSAIWALATDGARLYTGGEDGVMRTWDIGSILRTSDLLGSSALFTPASAQTLEPGIVTLPRPRSREPVRVSPVSWLWRMTSTERPGVTLMTFG
ncbi:MAG: hypothetical protein QGG50_04470 [Methanopyri archaeon]|nr:hypothetical protein [Methanopyri archaeon]